MGKIAYVADNWPGNLEILDISAPANPILLGSYTPPDGPRAVVVVGTRVFMACGLAGLVIISAADPTNPTFLGSYNTPGHFYHGLAIRGSNVYVPPPARTV